jgi:hypothetical protein
MIDWMIEVLHAYKQDDQTFFMAVSILDRYFQCKATQLIPSDLHLTGVTCMFIASKYEDYHPLRMQDLFKNICKEQYSVEQIKNKEIDIMMTIRYMVSVPTSLDFLKTLLQEVLGIEHVGRRSLTTEEKLKMDSLKSDSVEGTKLLLYRMSIYLAKMAMHSYEFSEILPS